MEHLRCADKTKNKGGIGERMITRERKLIKDQARWGKAMNNVMNL